MWAIDANSTLFAWDATTLQTLWTSLGSKADYANCTKASYVKFATPTVLARVYRYHGVHRLQRPAHRLWPEINGRPCQRTEWQWDPYAWACWALKTCSARHVSVSLWQGSACCTLTAADPSQTKE